MTDPAQIRGILGENLQILAASYSSITSLSHELGINRTQLNRYMSGESFPRPDVLARICDFFGVDARILLEPLKDIKAKHKPSVSQYMKEFSVSDVRELSEEMFPSGFYRFARRSFIDPDVFVIGLIYIFREGRNTYLKGYETTEAMRMQNLPHSGAVREFRGVVLPQEEGIAIIASRKNAMTTSFNYLSRVGSFNNNFWVGYITRTIPESTDNLRATRLVYEYLPQNLSEILKAARGKGFYRVENLEPFHRRLLKPDQPFT